VIVYGQNPVRELLKARGKEVSVVYIAAGDTGAAIKELWKLCKERGILFHTDGVQAVGLDFAVAVALPEHTGCRCALVE